MIQIISKYITPPGGWYFINGIHTISGSDYSNLLKNVSDHFVNNQIEVPNVEELLQAQIAERWPSGKIKRG